MKIIKSWLPLAVVITAMCGLVYATVQQVYRQSANDPQIQIAEDIANFLAQGGPPEKAVPASKINIAKSLAPFVAVFNDQGELVLSSAALDGQTPTPPAGVFEYARLYGENRVTWQPRLDVRSAIVVTRYKGGFVMAGRSLREVENREHKLELMVLIAWLTTLAATLLAKIIFEKFFKDK